MPGANPSGVSGIDTNIPPLTEENIVEIIRLGGAVGVRPAGERGVRNLEYYRPRIQTGPRGAVVTNPGGTAKLVFADDSSVTLHDTALVWLGDAAKGEPWVVCDRLTYLDINIPPDAKFNLIELPGGAMLKVAPKSKIKISLDRERYYRIRNEGATNVELTVLNHSTVLKTADSVELPVVRNRPARSSPADGQNIQIGEATFNAENVEFDPLLDAGSRQIRRANATENTTQKLTIEKP